MQPHRGLWVTDPGAFPFDDRLAALPGTSKPPVAARWVLGSRGLSFSPLKGRGPSALALDAPDPHDARLTVPPVGLDPPWQPAAVPGLALLRRPGTYPDFHRGLGQAI